MRRDLVFLALIVVVGLVVFLFITRTDEPVIPPNAGTPASGTAESPATVADGRDDAPAVPPDSPPAEGGREKDETGSVKKPVERTGSTDDAGLDFVVEEARFDDMELGDVLTFLTEQAGIRFDVPADLLIGEEARVTLAADKISARNVIALIVMTKGLTWEVSPDGVVVIRRPK